MRSNSFTSLSKHVDFFFLDELALVVAFSSAYFSNNAWRPQEAPSPSKALLSINSGKSKQSYFTCVTASPIPNPSTWLKISFQTTMRDILPGRAFNPAGAARLSKPDHTRPADFREKGRGMDQLANQSKSKPLASVTFYKRATPFSFILVLSATNLSRKECRSGLVCSHMALALKRNT